MDQEVHAPEVGEIETATLNGSRRQRAERSPWRVADRRPPTWWSRLVSLVVRHDDDDTTSPEIETRGRR